MVRIIKFSAIALGFGAVLVLAIGAFGAEMFGKTITSFVLSLWGATIGLVICSHTLGGKYYFSLNSPNGNWGLPLALSGFALIIIGPFLATHFFAEQTTYWGALALYLFGVGCGVIMRIGAVEPPKPFSSLSKEEREEAYLRQNHRLRRH